MENKQVKIQISGIANSGKSTIMYIIKQALINEGFKVSFEVGDDFENSIDLFDRIMQRKYFERVDALMGKTDIIIEETQTSGLEDINYSHVIKTISLHEIVNEIIKKEARPEAMLILSHSNRDIVDEFLEYYKKGNSDNICCMVLDRGKYQLVLDGIMVQNEGDHFGFNYDSFI